MSAAQSPISRKKQMLEKEIEYKQKSLKAYKEYINSTDDEIICVLEAKKSKKEEEFKKCYWIQYWSKSILSNEISNLQRRIEELKSLEERARELDELIQQLRDISGHGWGQYPGSLDNKIVFEYGKKFKTLALELSPPLNIIMIGAAGSGKSSFLRTFATALSNSDYIKDVYRVCPIQGREISATKQIHIEPILFGDKGQKTLPCKFFDMPGTVENEMIKKDELEKIVNGELKFNKEMDQQADIQKPYPADVVHCILYVISPSTTNLDDMSICTKSMIEFLKSKNSEDGVRQFVVVTSIDTIGVPNSDMKNAYKYPCVYEHCKKVSVAFGVDLLHVIPVSNYFDEVVPNDAKNAMSLFNLWRVFNSTKEYMERRWLKGKTIMISQELTCKKNNV